MTRKRSFLSVRPSGLERSRPADLVFCTLLGPEGPGRRGYPLGCSVEMDPLDFVPLKRLLRRGEYRPYFENYTVDASILDRAMCLSRYRSFITTDLGLSRPRLLM